MRAGYQHLVHRHYVDRLRRIHAARDARLAALSTAAEAQEYVEAARRAVAASFQPVPDKTPLNVQVTRTVTREAYDIECLTFESRPQTLVTANLYLPHAGAPPHPGVIFPCGHSGIGKAEPLYQECCQRLARAGFVVLIYDPYNQGERDQFFALPEDSPLRRNCCQAHNMMGKQMELLGEYFGMWRAWDGMRALDVLLERPEVDPKHLGLTGNSGGGTMSTWLWAAEPRFTMAAPSCFVTTFLANLENEIPADCEQYPPGVLGAGCEMADLLAAAAPKPISVVGQKYCYFDRRGLTRASEDLKHVYRLLDDESKVELFIGDNPHGFHPDAQQHVTRFFCRHAGLPAPNEDGFTPVVETPETLYATETGEVVPAGSRPVWEQLSDRAASVANTRPELTGSALQAKLKELLGLGPVSAAGYRVLRADKDADVPTARYAVPTEPDIEAIVRKPMESDRMGSLDVGDSVAVYVPHIGAAADIKDGQVPASIAALEYYAVDCRGMGESAPDEECDFLAPYGMDYMFHGYALLFGESYLGRRVHDILTVAELLLAEGAREVTLCGRGQGALIALLAAVVDGRCQVVLKNAPLRCQDWLETPVVGWPSASFVRGLLHHLDLPDCIRALGPRVRLIAPWGADMAPLDDDALAVAMARAGLAHDLLDEE